MRLIPLENYSELVEPKIVKFLLRKSEGVIGEIANILRVAARKAIISGKEMIDLELRLCRTLGDNVERPCPTKALAKCDMLIAGLGHLPRLKFAALSKVSA